MNDPSTSAVTETPHVVEYDEQLADADAQTAFVLELPYYRRQFEAGLKRSRWAAAKGVLACGLFMMGFGALTLGEPHVLRNVACFTVGVMLGFFLLCKRATRGWYEMHVREHNRRQARREEIAYPRHIRVAVSAEGVSLGWPSYELRAGWKYVWLVAESATHVHVLITSGVGVAVPIGAFQRASDAGAFAGAANALMERAGESERQRLTRFLADSDQTCPSCGYALRGVTCEKCPECGRALDRLELREVAAKRGAKQVGRRSFRIVWPWTRD